MDEALFEKALQELKSYSQITPITIKPHKKGWELLDGAYIYHAASHLGWNTITARIQL